MTQATMMDAWARVGAEHGDPPMLLERDGDKSIYWMHGKKGEYDGVYAIWHGTTFTCYRSRDEAWNAWEKLKDDRTVKSEKRITKRKAKEMCIYDREKYEYRHFL